MHSVQPCSRAGTVFLGSTLGEIAAGHLESDSSRAVVPGPRPFARARAPDLAAAREETALSASAMQMTSPRCWPGWERQTRRTIGANPAFLSLPAPHGRARDCRSTRLEKRVAQLQESRGRDPSRGWRKRGREDSPRHGGSPPRRASRHSRPSPGQCLPRSGPRTRGDCRRAASSAPAFSNSRGPMPGTRPGGDGAPVWQSHPRASASMRPSSDGLPAEQTYPEPAELPAEAARLRLFTYLSQTFARSRKSNRQVRCTRTRRCCFSTIFNGLTT
jgi:hypothetical protein